MSLDTYTYKTVAGLSLQADVHRPGGEGARPVIVWLHGGALIFGRRDGIHDRHLAAYLAAGYLVVSPDYRLAPETKLPEIAADLRDAFAWVRETGPDLFGADPTRVAAVGHSAGGYLALLAGATVAPRLQALVSFYGYGDILADWYRLPDPFYCQQPLVSEAEARAAVGTTPRVADAEGRGRFYLYCRQHGLWPQEVGGLHDDALRAYCPVRHLAPDYPPALLLHGTSDTDVPYEQSAQLAQELARLGVPHQLLTIEDGPHGFDYRDDARTAAAFSCVVPFLRQHLG